jgi:3-deoxy-D-manno-octulosonic acid kinase
VRLVSLGERGDVVVRPYRRGGFVRYFVRDLYWDRPPRPFVELLCTETARQRGVATVEPIGACVEWVRGGLYRGLLATRKAEDFHNLWEWLRTKPTEATREATLRVVARAIAHMHEAGIAHADLNLMNILVQPATNPPQALLIDFDRARLFLGPVPSPDRERNLRRLRRSLDKLDPEGVFFSSDDLEIFCREYRALALESSLI